MTVLHLVRHGQVENPGKVVYGRLPGWHLSPQGSREVEAVARHLLARPVVQVYTSPLERARETAEVLARTLSCGLEVRADLLEAALCTAWEGRSWREVRGTDVAGWIRYLKRPHEIREVPETLDALAERMVTALRAIADLHPNQEVAAVSHGDPIKAALLALTGGGLDHLHDEPVPTGGVVTVELEGDAARIVERWDSRGVEELPATPGR